MKRLIYSLLLLLLFQIGNAQTKPASKPKPVAAGTKAPIVKAYWGTFTSGTYTIAQLKNIIDNSLILKDDKGVAYAIKKCSFLYKRKLVNKDDETGKTTVTWEYAEAILKDGKQLDELWRKTIKEELKEGEELIFGGILANTTKGFVIPVANISFVAKK